MERLGRVVIWVSTPFAVAVAGWVAARRRGRFRWVAGVVAVPVSLLALVIVADLIPELYTVLRRRWGSG